MNNRDKSALALALAIVGGMAAGMRCDASVTVEPSSQTNPRHAAYTVKAYTDPFVHGAAEKRRANAELKAIAADVKKTMQTGFAEVKSGIADVGAKVDAVGKKASPRRAKCRGKYTSAQIEFCARVWDSAYGIQEIRNSTNTKVSYEAVFRFYRRQLAKLGIESLGQFKSVVRASQARARRELEANRGRSAATDRGKNGIIPAVKRHTKTALFTALAIVSAAVAPMRSDASVTVETPTQINLRPAAYTVKTYTEGSDPNAANLRLI